MLYCIYINKNLNRKLGLIEVICKLKIGDVRRFEVFGLVGVINGSDDNIFDESVYIDCFFICYDVD